MYLKEIIEHLTYFLLDKELSLAIWKKIMMIEAIEVNSFEPLLF